MDRARALNLTPAVLTFDPHPVRLLAPAKAPQLITTAEQKLRLIESMGIQLVVTVRFDSEFASLSPAAFIEKYLVRGLHTKTLCVGQNFTFGTSQSGNIETLHGWRREFEVVEIPPVATRGVVVSSTNVRRRIQDGKVSGACRLLGRWFEMDGSIGAGTGRGAKVTVPTLNLQTANELLPRYGVYISRIAVDNEDFKDSITNIGMRPTFEGNSETIETFILRSSIPAGAPGAPEARTARLQFLKRVRDERKFDSPELLKEQIGRDVQSAEKFFRRLQSGTHARIHSN